MAYRLGIDLGATSAKIALFGHGHKIQKETSVITSGFPKPGALIKKMAYACKDISRGKKIHRIGVGVAGDIDSDNGIVRVSPNLGWSKVPLGRLLRRRMKCAVKVENDAKAAAWGYYQTQVSKKIRNMMVMTLGTGVGGGLILNGALYRGATGSAGEVGHLNIDVKGPLCNCGLRGCLETYVGGPHLVMKVRRDLENGQRSRLERIFREDPDQITPYEISMAAKAGDSYAKSIWNQAGWALGVAVGDLIYLLNLELIVFTGGIAQAKNLLMKPLWNTLSQRTFKTPVNAVTIRIATNATHIGVVGASLL